MNRERLLNVARALREAPNPEKFDMGSEIHRRCGTPACAWGHYAAREDLQSAWKVERDKGGYFDVREIGTGRWASYDDDALLDHFDITPKERLELFDADGCGGAQTPIEAAEYIEEFVRRHEVQP